MPQKTATKRKAPLKPKMREYELAYHLELPRDVPIDDFVDRLVELVESLDGYIGGGAFPYTARDNGKEKRPQRSAN